MKLPPTMLSGPSEEAPRGPGQEEGVPTGRGSSEALVPSKDCICQARVPPVPSANVKNPGSCLWDPDQKVRRPSGVGPPDPSCSGECRQALRADCSQKGPCAGQAPHLSFGLVLAAPTATHAYQLASRVSTEVTPSRTLGPLHAKEAVERLPPPHPMHHLGEASRG